MKIIRFGELYSIPTSNGVSRPSAVRGEGFHMINMGELFSFDVINEMPMERVFLSDKEQKKYLVKKGDLLFARQSLVAAGAGKCSIVNNILEPTTFESHLIRVRLDETRCCPRYYYYLFKLPDNPIKTIVNQCAQAGIRGSELQKIKVPLPMLAEQHRIASILSAYDNLIENNNKRIRLLEQMAENLYKEWFVGFRFPGHEKAVFENGIPKGWKKGKLRDLAIEVDKTEKAENRNKYNHYLPIDKLPMKSMALQDEDLVDNAESSLISFKRGDILFGAMRPYFHKVLIAPFDGLTRSTCFVVNAHAPIYKNFLYLLMFQKSTVEYASTIAVGSTMPYVRWKDLARMNIIIPDLKLIDNFNKIVNPVLSRILENYQMNKNLSHQRDLLLPRLMSGRLEV